MPNNHANLTKFLNEIELDSTKKEYLKNSRLAIRVFELL